MYTLCELCLCMYCLCDSYNKLWNCGIFILIKIILWMLPLEFVVFYVVTVLSLCSCLYVFWSLISLGSFQSCFTILLLFLHGSLILEMITAFPYAYNYDENLCSIMRFFHYYFSLMNIFVVALLVEAHRSIMLKDYFGSRKLILKYGIFAIVLFPCVTAIGFFSELYYISSGSPWCVLSYRRTGWSIGVYSSWMWILLGISIFSTCYSGFRIYQTDYLLAKKFFSTIGLYTFIALSTWLPRAIERAVIVSHPTDVPNHFLSIYPYVISGLLYTILYVQERKSLSGLSELPQDSIFSWEQSEITDSDRPMRRTRRTTGGSGMHSSWSRSSNPFMNFYPRPSSEDQTSIEVTTKSNLHS